MHEKVLSASTLGGGRGRGVEISNQVSKNVNALVQALRVLVCHSDLTAPGSGKPAVG